MLRAMPPGVVKNLNGRLCWQIGVADSGRPLVAEMQLNGLNKRLQLEGMRVKPGTKPPSRYIK
jgi:hypothetical protein